MDVLNFLTNAITEDDTYGYTIVDVLRMRSRETPDKTAYTFLKDGDTHGETITYKELHDAAASVADYLKSVSRPNERALMLFPPGLDFIKSLFACFYAGIIAVPAYPPRKNRSLSRIRSVVTDCKASLVLATEKIHTASIKNFHDVAGLKELSWVQTNKIEVSGEEPEFVVPEGKDIALLQYTSGSTGTPKGVMVTHTNIMRNSEYIRNSFELSRESVSVCWLPSFHDMGLVDGVIQPVFTGFHGVLIPPVSFLQKPVRWMQAITRYGGTHAGGPNFGYDLCVEKITEAEKKTLDLSSLRTLYNGAEPIRKVTQESFTHYFRDTGFKPQAFYPCYGMAETTLIISGVNASDKPTYLPVIIEELEKNKVVVTNTDVPEINYQVGVGHAWIDTDIRIVDPETGTSCSDGRVGEIWVSGSIVTKGYWGNAHETKKTFHGYISGTGEGPYLRTGDLGFFYNGELFISGRLKDLIIIRGRNIYPQDIEFIVEASHEALRPNCSAAFSVDIDGVEKLVIAAELERVFVRDPDTEGICDSIREQVFEEFELEVFAVALLRTASIPKTSSGKIQRRACRNGFIMGELNEVGRSVLDDEPVTAGAREKVPVSILSIQSWLMAWISNRLKIGISKIHPGRPIVAYGMNSLKAVQLRNDFLENFGVDFPPYLFYNKMTIEDAAQKAWELVMEKNEDWEGSSQR